LKRRRTSGEEQRAAEAALTLMPRAVRDKLDAVGVKLHLAEWDRLPMVDRERLRDLDCASSDEIDRYRERLIAMLREHCGKDPDRLVRREP